MKIAIVDDEKLYQDKEKKLLEDYDKTYKIETYTSTKELLASKKTFDLLLLDIEMPDEDGIEFARNHMTKFPYIIFVTSYKEHYARAYNPNVVGFIEKDTMDVRLLEQILDVKKRILEEAIITFKTKIGHVNVMKKLIQYFCIEYRTFYVVTDEKMVIQITSFKEIHKRFPVDFFQINRSQIINLNNVESIYKSTHTIQMRNGDILEVSDRKWKGFKEAYVRVKVNG